MIADVAALAMLNRSSTGVELAAFAVPEPCRRAYVSWTGVDENAHHARSGLIAVLGSALQIAADLVARAAADRSAVRGHHGTCGRGADRHLGATR